jgi:hypothetical protein
MGQQRRKRLGQSSGLMRMAPDLFIEERKTILVALPVGIPVSALRLFIDVLAEIGEGNSVSIVPIHAELTTQEAADLLNVSRPLLVQLLAGRSRSTRSERIAASGART